ncbi:hypothetical protein PDN64_12425 [Bacillus cereus group sp. Bc256]|uniref:hypothetical protein n=1 Tax=unclassified Bacillus cereus group TaxID=2750818 RepID=UPI001F55F92C|nr:MULTISPECIES: hypothetical protein [unclassified Bacillus cereus group]MDA2138938.1 hypothetical protein [Bacillus cereus group sp. Bc256]MDA2598337.1 hypothetical protein [Bacillus cereus group sp. Bc061]
MNEKTKEAIYAMAKGAAGTVPVAGPMLSELFGVAFADPASKRRTEILEEMDRRLHALEQKGFNISELADNQEFLTVAMQAYSIALKTHQKDKRVALMNSISNTPKLGIEENEKLMFLNYIDQFNEWHLKILSFLNSPESYFTAETRPSLFSGGKSTILVSAFPELGDRRDFYDQIVRDLKNRDLIAYDTLHNTMSETGLWQSGTTEVGKRFLEFISE